MEKTDYMVSEYDGEFYHHWYLGDEDNVVIKSIIDNLLKAKNVETVRFDLVTKLLVATSKEDKIKW